MRLCTVTEHTEWAEPGIEAKAPTTNLRSLQSASSKSFLHIFFNSFETSCLITLTLNVLYCKSSTDPLQLVLLSKKIVENVAKSRCYVAVCRFRQSTCQMLYIKATWHRFWSKYILNTNDLRLFWGQIKVTYALVSTGRAEVLKYFWLRVRLWAHTDFFILFFSLMMNTPHCLC